MSENIDLQNDRFPEFLNNEEWKKHKLSEVLTEHGLKSDGTEEVFSVSVHKGVINQIEHLGRSFSAASTDHYKRVLPGDIIYTKSPTGDFPFGIIKQSKIDKAVIVSPLYGVFKPETYALGTILDSYFEFKGNTYNYLASIVQKGAKNTINILNDTFLSNGLFLPRDPKEQQKIADCLSSLDDLISNENKRLDALKNHKKGLMQQLFPVEGEKVPKFRFPEFKDTGDWEEKTLDEVCMSIGSGKNKNESDGAFSLYGSTGIIGKTTTNSFVGDFILVARVGANAGMLNKVSGSFGVTDNTLVLILKKSHQLNFVYYLLDNFTLNKLIFGSGQPLITAGQIKKLFFSFPEPLEQQKIASALSSIDEQVERQTQKIEHLKRHKKGLMQRLFPTIN